MVAAAASSRNLQYHATQNIKVLQLPFTWTPIFEKQSLKFYSIWQEKMNIRYRKETEIVQKIGRCS